MHTWRSLSQNGPTAKNVVAARFQCAILLCDHAWVDPDLQDGNGVLNGEGEDMLRCDAMLLSTQLNIRQLLEVTPLPHHLCQPPS